MEERRKLPDNRDDWKKMRGRDWSDMQKRTKGFDDENECLTLGKFLNGRCIRLQGGGHYLLQFIEQFSHAV